MLVCQSDDFGHLVRGRRSEDSPSPPVDPAPPVADPRLDLSVVSDHRACIEPLEHRFDEIRLRVIRHMKPITANKSLGIGASPLHTIGSAVKVRRRV